jgi:type IV secretion system protein TrbD
MEATEGYVVPIHHSLTVPLLLAGVPRSVALLNGTVVAALALGLHNLLAIPVGLIVHLLAVYATKWDPFFLEVGINHIKEKRIYHV